MAMAASSSLCCFNSLPLQPSSQQPRRLPEASPSSITTSSLLINGSSSSSSSSYGGHGKSCLDPIVVSGNPPTFVSAPNRRIVAVGDLHGDLPQARRALELAGVLSSTDGQYLWIGGETVLIQLGDITDRGEDEIAILSLLRSLDIQARAQGGAVFQINGNHETMNVEGDYRYDDPGGYDECLNFLEYLETCDDNWDEAFIGWVSVSEKWKEDCKLPQNSWDPWNEEQRQKGIDARSRLLRPGGPLACELARHAVVLKVEDWIFCHGGLLPHHVAYGIKRMNEEVSRWMRGHFEIDTSFHFPCIATRGYDSVVWNRFYSRDSSELEDYQIEQIASLLEETLQAVGAKGMVVGHTPQTTGVNCRYNCCIWCIDVGMSSGVLNSKPEVLEIRGGKASVIKSGRDNTREIQVANYASGG